jgi:integrase
MRARGNGTKTSKGYWRVKVNYTDEYNRIKTKYFERKTLLEAQHAAKLFLAVHGRSQHVGQEGTVKDLFDIVDREVWAKISPRHRKDMNLYRRAWVSRIGDMLTNEVDSPTLTRALNNIAKGKSQSYLNKALLAARQAFSYAITDLGWLKVNPADNVRKPIPAKKDRKYPPITQQEYDRMVALAEPRIRVIIRLVGECGMRPIEAHRVRPEHLFAVNDHWLVKIPKSKTEAGVRSVPVPDSLVREIENIREDDWEGIQDPQDHVRKWWRKNSETRLYDLRGWRADEWRRAGIPDQLRSFLLGHTDPKFTQTVYETITHEDTLKMFLPILDK